MLNKVKDDHRTVTISMLLAPASLYESWDQRDSYLRPQLHNSLDSRCSIDTMYAAISVSEVEGIEVGGRI